MNTAEKKSLKQTKIQNQGHTFTDLTWLCSVGLAQLLSSPFSPSVWLGALLWRSQIGSAIFFSSGGKLAWGFRCLVLQFAGLCWKADSSDDLGEKEDIALSSPHLFISWTNSVAFLDVVNPSSCMKHVLSVSCGCLRAGHSSSWWMIPTYREYRKIIWEGKKLAVCLGDLCTHWLGFEWPGMIRHCGRVHLGVVKRYGFPRSGKLSLKTHTLVVCLDCWRQWTATTKMLKFEIQGKKNLQQDKSPY